MLKRGAVALAVGVCGVAGCVGLSAPVFSGAIYSAPEDWSALVPSDRYRRAWSWHLHGVEYAHSAAIRENARLLATGASRAAEGLEVCATVFADPAAQTGALALAAEYRALERQSRGGRIWRPRRLLDDLEERARAYAPGTVDVIADPADAPLPVEGTVDNVAPPSTVTVRGTVIRKRVDISAGPDGEITAYVLTVLQRGGAETDVVVTAETWRATVIGDPAPTAPAADAEPPTPPDDGADEGAGR